MPVLDTDMITQMEYMLLECQPGNVPSLSTLYSSMWAYPDWVTALINRQNEFVRKTGITLLHNGYRGDSNSGIPIVPSQEVVALPQGTIEVLRVAFQTLDGTLAVIAIDEQPRDDAWSLDAYTQVNTGDWEYQTANSPNAFTESIAPPQQLYWANPPANSGLIDLLAINVAQTLTGAGVAMSVPDDFCHYVMYGTMADLLRKDGEAYWPQGADYCEARFGEGVQMARMLLRMGVRGQ